MKFVGSTVKMKRGREGSQVTSVNPPTHTHTLPICKVSPWVFRFSNPEMLMFQIPKANVHAARKVLR